MSENLYFYKGLERNLPESGIKVGGLYHCTDTNNTYIGTSATTMELWSSGTSYQQLNTDNSIGGAVFGEGNASGAHSIAGGTTDVSIIEDITGVSVDTLESMESVVVEILGNRGPRLASNLKNDPTPKATGVGSIAFGTGAESITAMSTTIGVGAEAGSKGFYFHKINIPTDGSNITVDLSTVQKPYYKYKSLFGGYTEVNTDTKEWDDQAAKDLVKSWSAEDEVNIIVKKIFCLCEKIVKVDSNNGTVTITNTGGITADDIADGIEFDNVISATAGMAALVPYQYSIAVPSKPDIGTIELHFAGISTGLGSIAAGSLSQAHGAMNVAAGQFGFVVGQQNEVGYGGFASGEKNKAMGYNTHAEGYKTKAVKTCSHSEGASTIAQGAYSHAEGYKGQSIGIASHAEGLETVAGGAQAHAEGYKTEATGTYSHTEGNTTKAKGNNSHAEGAYSETSNANAHAEGYNTRASGTSSHAEGFEAKASGQYSHAEGNNTEATSESGHAEGNYSKAYGNYSHAEGSWTEAYGEASHTEGHLTYASGNYSHAEGYCTTANDECAHAEGNDTHAVGQYSHAEGSGTWANAPYAHSEGVGAIANGNASHAEGESTQANGYASHAEGYFTTAEGDYSHAEGNNSNSSGIFSHAEGANSTASNYCAHAEGYGTTSSGWATHSEGESTFAQGTQSHAEGLSTSASGNHSHVEGYYTSTGAEATAAHAEGAGSSATGHSSHAEGRSTQAQGAQSHAEGDNTVATGYAQHVQGKYNSPDNTKAFIIGGGSSEKPNNIFTVDWDGNVETPGNIKAAEAEFTSDVSIKGAAKVSGALTASTFNGYTINKSVPADAKFTDTTYSVATTTSAGLMSAADKAKIDGLGDLAEKDLINILSTAAPKANGTASYGSSATKVAREDHVHPLQTSVTGSSGSCTGNAATASKVNNSLKIQLNSGTAEGTNQFTFDGGAAKTINITPGAIGAATSSHTHSTYVNQNAFSSVKVGDTTIAADTTTDTLTLSSSGLISLSPDSDNDKITIGISYIAGSGNNGLKLNSTSSNSAGSYSVAEGYNTSASGNYSHAEGNGASASGNYSHAEGKGTSASGNYSHAEGISTVSAGGGCHSEGVATYSSNEGAHAEGRYTDATAYGAHAEGAYTLASADNSHAEGYYTRATYDEQHVQGRYNATGNYAHIIGNGTASTPRNIHTVDWDGNAWYAGYYTLSSKMYGENLPTSGLVDGRLFFQI